MNLILQETWRYKQTWRTALSDEDIVFRLFAFFFLTIKSKRRKKKIKKRSTWVRPWLAKTKEQGFYHQLLTEISVVEIPAFPELLRMTRLSCMVATRALSLRFCRENFNSGDSFLAIFSPVASQVRRWLHVRFSSCTGDTTKFEKIASPACASKKSLVWPRL